MMTDQQKNQPDLDKLSHHFWRWRSIQQPRTGDDVPRVARPIDWRPDWSVNAVRHYRQQILKYRAWWKSLASDDATVSTQVDHRLIGSAIDRVHWELNVLKSWQRDPGFYVDQSVGVIFDLLLDPETITESRGAAIVQQLECIPRILLDGRDNLRAEAEFARLAAGRAGDAGKNLATAMAALAELLPNRMAQQVHDATRHATEALTQYSADLDSSWTSMPAARPIGPRPFAYLINRVALLPFTPAALIDIGRREFDRAVVLELLERHRNREVSDQDLPMNSASQISRHALLEEATKSFYSDRDLLTQPDSVPRYLLKPYPSYLEPLAWLGITDDLTSVMRIDQDAVSYIPSPSSTLAYFDKANAIDPRLGIVHEGAHHQQMSRAWRHTNPIRRHYYDSTPNEGIAFYNEEMMLASGFFDDSPRAREFIRNFMRLRALRVDIDVGLATGAYTMEDAADILEDRTPMDRQTAQHEATFFAATPGQGLSYQVGKVQVLDLMTSAIESSGSAFVLKEFHDYLWSNGNVPISLLRWELLGDREALDCADLLANAPGD